VGKQKKAEPTRFCRTRSSWASLSHRSTQQRKEGEDGGGEDLIQGIEHGEQAGTAQVANGKTQEGNPGEMPPVEEKRAPLWPKRTRGPGR